MFISNQRISSAARVLALGLAALAATASVAAAYPADDGRGGAEPVAATPVTAEPRTDFRSPDTRDAAEGYAPKLVEPAQSAPARTDFRSPDTRDAAEGYAPTYSSTVVEERAPEARGFAWGVAGLLLAGGAALALLAVATARSMRHARGRVVRP